MSEIEKTQQQYNAMIEKSLLFVVYPVAKGALTFPTQPLANIMVEGQKNSIGFSQAYRNLQRQGLPRFFQGSIPSVTRELQKSSYKGWLTVNAQEWSQNLLSVTGTSLDQSDIAVNLLAGIISGTVDAAFSGPFERYKTFALAYEGEEKMNFGRFIQNLNEQNKNLQGTEKANALRQELWRGFGVTSGKQSAMISGFFLAHSWSNQLVEPYKADYPTLSNASVALFSGCAAAAVSAPLDVAKTWAQKDIGDNTSLLYRMTHIYQKAGIAGLTRGLGAKCALTAVGYGFTGVFLNHVKEFRDQRSHELDEQSLIEEMEQLSLNEKDSATNRQKI